MSQKAQQMSHGKTQKSGGAFTRRSRSKSQKNDAESSGGDVISGEDNSGSTEPPRQIWNSDTIEISDKDGKKTTWQLEGDGAGRVVLVKMAPDSSFMMQPGAMICMSSAVSLSLDFGAKKTYRRFLGGESIVHTIARVPSDMSGEVRLAGTGDVTLFDLKPENKLIIAPSHYVASTPQVDLQLASLKSVGFWNRMATELFFMIAKGEGAIALEAFGQLQSRAITPDDGEFILDNDHVVAWTAGLKMSPALAAQNTQKDGKKRSLIRRALSSYFTGEGIVLAFSGTGTIFYQTRLDRVPPLMARIERIERRQIMT